MGWRTRSLASGKVDRVFRLEQTEAALEPKATSPGAVGDEEALPLGPASIDLFVSTLALQWTNDLPGALLQIRTALKPDGLFLAAHDRRQTLAELRQALFAAESEMRGGASPRVMPDRRRARSRRAPATGGLRPPGRRSRHRHGRATIPPSTCFASCGRWAASNALAERDRRPAARGFFLRAAEIYAERFSDPGRTHPRDLRHHLAIGLGAAREPAETGEARIRSGQPRGGAWRQKSARR